MFKVLKESPQIPENLSFEGKDFLRCCFQRDPADRPPASKLMDHPFLRISQLLDSPPSNQTSNLRTKVVRRMESFSLYLFICLKVD